MDFLSTIPTPDQIGERIRFAREMRRVSQTELAKSLGISSTTISKYEAGEVSNIPSDKVDALCKTLLVDPQWLLGFRQELDKDLDPLSWEEKKLIYNFRELNHENQLIVLEMVDTMEYFLTRKKNV